MLRQYLIDVFIFIYQFLFSFRFGVKRYVHKKSRFKNNRVHVFGSGFSAIKTREIILKDDITIGCNLSLALLPSWDFGFVERLEDDDFGLVQLSVLLNCEFGLLLLKNNYPMKHRKSFKLVRLLVDKYNMFILHESQFFSKNNSLDYILPRVADRDYFVMMQYASSIVTMIMFAVRNGCKDIVLHGVDFGGRCFYDTAEFDSFKPQVQSTSMLHQTESYMVPFSVLFDSLKDELAKDSINIRFAKDLL